MEFYIKVINENGEFLGEIFEGDLNKYESLKTHIKKVFEETVFEMELENGGFLVMYSEMIKKSLFILEKKPDTMP